MKISKLILAAVAVMALFSCETKETYVPELKVTASGSVINLGESKEATIDYRGGNLNLRVEANAEWTATCDETWVSLNPATGVAGQSTLRIQAEANPVFDLRTAVVRVVIDRDQTAYVELVIKQGADTPFITPSKDLVEFEKVGGSESVNIAANCAWTATCSESWVSLSPASAAAGTTALTVTATANTGVAVRTAQIVISSTQGVSAMVAVSQNPDLTGYYVDENGVNHGKGIKFGNTIWAPVNCGYRPVTAEDLGHPFGKYYQWGRPVGFGYNNDQAGVYEADPAININGPIEDPDAADPTMFYKNSSNWLTSAHPQLWNSGTEETPVKTKYDPCPKGWRVPTLAEFTEATKVPERVDGDFRVWKFTGDDGIMTLPCSGVIATGSDLQDRTPEGSTAGYYWTSTYESGVVILYYIGNWAGKNDWTNQPARGCMVRCVAE